MMEVQLSELNHEYFTLQLEIAKAPTSSVQLVAMEESLQDLEIRIKELQERYTTACVQDAMLIQATLSGRQARVEVARMAEETRERAALEDDSAYRIQASIAGRNARREVASMEAPPWETTEEEEVIDEVGGVSVSGLSPHELETMGLSSSQIQGVMRGRDARRRVRRLQHQEEASYVLTSAARGYGSRRQVSGMPRVSEREYELNQLQKELEGVLVELKGQRRGSLEWAKLKVSEGSLTAAIDEKIGEIQMERVTAARMMVGGGREEKRGTPLQELEGIMKVLLQLRKEFTLAPEMSPQADSISSMISEMEAIVEQKEMALEGTSDATRLIQGGVRGYSTRRDYEKRDAAASVIQGSMTGRASRIESDSMLLQSSSRGEAREILTALSLQLQEIEQELKREKQAGKKAQLSAKIDLLKERIALQEEKINRLNTGASGVQAALRGRKARSEVSRLYEMDQSARIIQAAMSARNERVEIGGLYKPTEAEFKMEGLNIRLNEIQTELINKRRKKKSEPELWASLKEEEAALQRQIEIVYAEVYVERARAMEIRDAGKHAGARTIQASMRGRSARQGTRSLHGVAEEDLEILNDEVFVTQMEALRSPERDPELEMKAKVAKVTLNSAMGLYTSAHLDARHESARVIQGTMRIKGSREETMELMDAVASLSENEIILSGWEDDLVVLEAELEAATDDKTHDRLGKEIEEGKLRVVAINEKMAEAEEAAVRIQATMAGKSGRIQVRRRQAMADAAPVLQAGIQGRMARKAPRPSLPLLSTLALEDLNTALAGAQRDLLAKKKGSLEWAEALLAEASIQEEIDACRAAIEQQREATMVLQAGVNVYAGRREAERRRDLNRSQDEAMDVIYSGFQGYQSRRDLIDMERDYLNEAAYPIQGLVRGREGRADYSRRVELDGASYAIQAGIRGRGGRREVWEMGPGPGLKLKLDTLATDVGLGYQVVDVARVELQKAEEELHYARMNPNATDEDIENAENAISRAMEALSEEVNVLKSQRTARRSSIDPSHP